MVKAQGNKALAEDEGEVAHLQKRALELDVREQHVDEKVNALETMKLLLIAGSTKERALLEALEGIGEQHRLELMVVKEEADARDSLLSDKLIRAEMEIQRLSAEVLPRLSAGSILNSMLLLLRGRMVDKNARRNVCTMCCTRYSAHFGA